jgi:hypothetical protein
MIALRGEGSVLNTAEFEPQEIQANLMSCQGSSQHSDPIKIGEIESTDIHLGYLQEESRSQMIHYSDASFIKVHFATLRLLEGDYVTVSDPTGIEIYTYPNGPDDGSNGENGLWATSVMGDTAIIELHSEYNLSELKMTTEELQQYGAVIDGYTRGYGQDRLNKVNGDLGIQEIHGENDHKDVICYQSSYATEYERSQAVALLILDNGTRDCTGWRVGPRGETMLTNEHCITSQEELAAAEIWFNYQATTCGGDDTAEVTKVMGDTLLMDNDTLDFALFTIKDPQTAAKFGYVEIDARGPVLDEEIYIPQHPEGEPKKFGIESDVNSGNLCRIDEVLLSGNEQDTDSGYYCDTLGGSSGSPVLARSSHKAIALHHMGGTPNSGVRFDRIWPKIKSLIYGYYFIDPKQNDVLPIGVEKEIIFTASDLSKGVKYVQLSISPIDNDSGGEMTALGSNLWSYKWTPQPQGGITQQTYTLLAKAYDENHQYIDQTQIQVSAEGINPVDPWIEGPRFVYLGIYTKFTAKAPDAVKTVLKINGVDVCQKDGPECEYWWRPTYKGTQKLEVVGHYQGGGQKTEPMNVQVGEAPDVKYLPVNQYATLVRVEGIKGITPLTGLDKDAFEVPLGISSDDYACGVVNYDAHGGDIGEVWDYDGKKENPSLIGVFLQPDYYGNYELIADINSWNRFWALGWVWEDRPETWDVDVLCVRKNIATVIEMDGLGDNVKLTTDIPFSQQICTIAGFHAHGGDINEKGDHDIIQMYLSRYSGKWRIRADFVTHKPSEKWDIDLLCLNSDVASLDGPLPDKLFFVQEYYKLGDNVGAKKMIDTGFSETDYVCGVAGFAARDGDIDERNYEGTNTNLLLAYMYPQNGTWHIRADFRTHKDHENWDVNVICALREGGTHVQWNVSHLETQDENCIKNGMQCQVLRHEGIIDFPEKYRDFVLWGGGYTSAPSSFKSKCSGSADIEVYINKREPGTERVRWSRYKPDKCLQSGDILRIQVGNTYDLRGVSMVGGMTRPFELRPPDDPPRITKVEPMLYTAEYEPGKKYGPGMRLEWIHSPHPEMAFYEIQFSEDGGTTWQIYKHARDDQWDWVNHHGNLQCRHGFYRCLKRNQVYHYRIRALDSAKTPITDWSDVVSATSMEWPANVELAATPPGPQYPSNSIVTLDLVNTYGPNLQIVWQIHPQGKANYEILDGTCKNGAFSAGSQVRQCKLRIWVSDNAGFFYDGESMKLAAPLMAYDYVRVNVTGTDSLGYQSSDQVDLTFKKAKEDPIDT